MTVTLRLLRKRPGELFPISSVDVICESYVDALEGAIAALRSGQATHTEVWVGSDLRDALCL